MNDSQHVDSEVAPMCVSTTAMAGEPRELLLRGNKECEHAFSQLKALGVIGVHFVIQRFDDGDMDSIPGNTFFAKGVRLSASLTTEVNLLRRLLSASAEDALRESLSETAAYGLEMIAKCSAEYGAEGWRINAYVYAFTSEPLFNGIRIKLM
jgi:hypothetical protein